MSDIADFLRARYAEARTKAEGWRRQIPSVFDGRDVEIVHESGNSTLLVDGHPYPADKYYEVATVPAPDPDVIADLDAKLALVDELDYEPPAAESEADPELHARRAHPAWEYATTEGPRKQWDDVDVPPHDDYGNLEPGWERNTDAGREGWERFDYTEESYWRRPRPGGPRPTHIPRALKILAQPFAGHPDHKGEEWAP
ncbi:DUF6221 family protein [Streptomyces ortus]|uniref:WW domain-containing protein n=1 Tax=Streptomyces ortus TaxID=2867268 RepID=A0ABT3UWT7_9ACTN|nr:DUF6221 family protein [Streptomyces ortus]MCX4232028.1 hypothetical protein [Streptomyces ortus]